MSKRLKSKMEDNRFPEERLISTYVSDVLQFVHKSSASVRTIKTLLGRRQVMNINGEKDRRTLKLLGDTWLYGMDFKEIRKWVNCYCD